MGTLRRSALAGAVESSTAIEGFIVPHADALALVTGQSPSGPVDENRLAVACYARAMDRVGAMADDPDFRWLDRRRPRRSRHGPRGDGAPQRRPRASVRGRQRADLAHRPIARWVEFCVDAHLTQARRRLEQIDLASKRWTALEALAKGRGWPERIVIALEQALVGGTDRRLYAGEADVATATATNDLRRLLDAGLVEQLGLGRSTRYQATERLRDAIN